MRAQISITGTTLQRYKQMIYEGEGEATSMFEKLKTTVLLLVIRYTYTQVVKLDSYKL